MVILHLYIICTSCLLNLKYVTKSNHARLLPGLCKQYCRVVLATRGNVPVARTGLGSFQKNLADSSSCLAILLQEKFQQSILYVAQNTFHVFPQPWSCPPSFLSVSRHRVISVSSPRPCFFEVLSMRPVYKESLDVDDHVVHSLELYDTCQ